MAVFLVKPAKVVQVHEEEGGILPLGQEVFQVMAQKVGPREAGEGVKVLAQGEGQGTFGEDSEKLSVLHDQKPLQALGLHQALGFQEARFRGDGHWRTFKHVHHQAVGVGPTEVAAGHHPQDLAVFHHYQAPHPVFRHEPGGLPDADPGLHSEGFRGHGLHYPEHL
ncbi:hypothetical protein GCM10007092_15480 [Thermus composti]|nr:hypothetical protein GCM10007092_15480 [Thermus composti]